MVNGFARCRSAGVVLDVGQAKSASPALRQRRFGNADASIENRNQESGRRVRRLVVALQSGRDPDLAAGQRLADSMFDGVFDEGLNHQRWNS